MQILCYILAYGKEIGTLLLGVAAILTFLFLIFRGRSWYESTQIKVAQESILLQQQEHQRKFKFDVAVEAVDLFSKLKVDFDLVRSPAYFGGEIEALENLEEINDFVKKIKKHKDAGVIFIRLDERAETAAAANRLRAKFNAAFGDVSPFETVASIRHKIWVSAQMLTHELSAEMSNKHHDVIWKTEEEDEISREMARAVQRVEELCIPVIRGETELSSSR